MGNNLRKHEGALFAGTQVPVVCLFEFLQGGGTVDSFLKRFPTVTREQVVRVLSKSRDLMLSE
jgi:uncharacterized protein (DUF433 family)